MTKKGFVVSEASLFWTDDMMATSHESGFPKFFFQDKNKAEEYRQQQEVKKWKEIFTNEAPEMDGMDYERPERSTLTVVYPEGEKIYQIEN